MQLDLAKMIYLINENTFFYNLFITVKKYTEYRYN